jgi:UDP-N-acetyl-D-mannosaminuronic acid dehydrogenase
MAPYAVEKLAACIGDLRGRDVIILGLAYRANVKESAHSSALLIARALSERGANPLVHDPLYTSAEMEAHGLSPLERIPAPASAVVVQAWHDSYHDLKWADFVGAQAVLDGRGVVSRAAVEAAGLAYIGIGR